MVRKSARRVTNPVQNRDVTDAENAGDGAEDDVAHRVQKQDSAFIAGGFPHRSVMVKLQPHEGIDSVERRAQFHFSHDP